MANNTLALQMRGIRKRFPGVVALDGVDLALRGGEVHVLLGENGAGKSTLMKVLSGAYPMDAGTIDIGGVPVLVKSPRHAQNLGIGIIYQELTLVPALTAAQNIYLGREPRGALGVIRSSLMTQNAQRILDTLGDSINANVPVRELSLAQRQLVEIAKALSLDPRILVMDEPTSALTARETALLFAALRMLTATGVAVIYISHRLDEIFEIGDRVTVLRDGMSIATHEVAGTDRNQLVSLMANREINERITKTTSTRTGELLNVRNLTRTGVVHDVSFSVHAGEVLGIAGLMGAGRTEIARLIFGLDAKTTGEIRVEGVRVDIRSPGDAIRHGLGFVTEDRKAQGLVLGQSIRANIALPVLRFLSRLGFVWSGDETTLATDYLRHLRIRAPNVAEIVLNLSGGNQQKIVLAKWLAAKSRVLFLDEPTRGIDVAAKQEIYALINRLAGEGVGVVLISSELPEIIGLSDRVIVMRDGRIVGEFSHGEATQSRVLACAVGAAA